MLELTDSQKLRAIATAADCPEDAPFDVVVAAVRKLTQFRETIQRRKFGILGALFADAQEIDEAIAWLMKNSKKK